MHPITGLPAFPDKFFDLAIVDPPYGGGQHFNFRFDEVYENHAPSKEYFDQLFRVSKNQIVWGGNYFTDKIPVSRCWLAWQKGNPLPSFSDFELAWTSFDKVSINVKIDSYGFRHGDKVGRGEKTIHPTQKPVALYQWLLDKFAQPGFKILDTHVGSGSSLVAFQENGYEYVGYEIDPKYYKMAKKRIDKTQKRIVF